ncbi:Transmembrane domain-containing protein [Spironucleus salmonicida]|uniref:Transmembrane domain-containing protein n=1 Tax=Spironucleus salmonicida TaxID=348837 RepID=V6LNH2_9EUKA|nr:Transmembrane domain-containing protein [Spironucleus salmonicida]|eukprot:EST42284.1 TolA and transmembrane domain-containing protein [Spironucleus salmonicida]
MDQGFIWTIVNMVLAILLSICSIFKLNSDAANDFKHIFLILLDIIIMLIPLVTKIHPYFLFLVNGICCAFLLMIIALLEFSSLSGFCTNAIAVPISCYSDVITTVVWIVCIIQIFLRKSEVQTVVNMVKQTAISSISAPKACADVETGEEGNMNSTAKVDVVDASLEQDDKQKAMEEKLKQKQASKDEKTRLAKEAKETKEAKQKEVRAAKEAKQKEVREAKQQLALNVKDDADAKAKEQEDTENEGN